MAEKARKHFPVIRQDFARFYQFVDKSLGRRIIAFIESPGLHAVICYRFVRWCSAQSALVKYPLKPLSVYLRHRMKVKWGIEINAEKIGPGFVVFHYGGIIIGPGVEIGENCQISHTVTIGEGSPGSKAGFPVIGNNVSVNAGAQIYGRIRIGNNVRIGPNAVVSTNIPDDAIVHHLPMRVVVFPRITPKKPEE